MFYAKIWCLKCFKWFCRFIRKIFKIKFKIQIQVFLRSMVFITIHGLNFVLCISCARCVIIFIWMNHWIFSKKTKTFTAIPNLFLSHCSVISSVTFQFVNWSCVHDSFKTNKLLFMFYPSQPLPSPTIAAFRSSTKLFSTLEFQFTN